ATTVHQQVHISTLKNFQRDLSEKRFSSPSLVIIGKVVNLYQQFKWFKSEKQGTVFNELETANLI
ncbi:MAG: uroporphyrinogen-III C-methyltransferase, partial [Ginsengibacter sp.]